MSKINNTQIDNVKSIDVAIPMYNLMEYSDNYSKIRKQNSKTESLQQCYSDEPALIADDAITDFPSDDGFPSDNNSSNNNNNNNNNNSNNNSASLKHLRYFLFLKINL